MSTNAGKTGFKRARGNTAADKKHEAAAQFEIIPLQELKKLKQV